MFDSRLADYFQRHNPQIWLLEREHDARFTRMPGGGPERSCTGCRPAFHWREAGTQLAKKCK
ncbi:MAG: hypothetical protein MI976_11655 [Pseudomonadales bacterium]|nr:hypothetical protein [Pseudomonadales bacterium]